MKYRKAIIGLAASASLLGSAGFAAANHIPKDDYSPCREGEDAFHTGYSHDGPRSELPTVYGNAGQDTTPPNGHVGICSGNRHGHPNQEPVRYVEAGIGDDGLPYVKGSAPEADGLPVATGSTSTPANEHGMVTVGDDYVEIDGTEDNAGSEEIHSWLDGYASAGLTEDDGEPGICMSGDNNRDYYQNVQPQQRDCNEDLLAAGLGELG